MQHFPVLPFLTVNAPAKDARISYLEFYRGGPDR